MGASGYMIATNLDLQPGPVRPAFVYSDPADLWATLFLRPAHQYWPALPFYQAVGSRPDILPPDILPYALVLTMGRLALPWQLTRLAIKSAETDDAIRIAGAPYAAAVTIVLSEVERSVSALKADLDRGANSAAASLIKMIHNGVRGFAHGTRSLRRFDPGAAARHDPQRRVRRA